MLSRSELANLAVGLPIVTAILGGMAGLGVGVGVGWVIKPAPPPIEALAETSFSADQIQFKCGQIRGEELKTANERIAALTRERDEYEQRVLALEAEVESAKAQPARGSTPGAVRVAAAELEGKVASLRHELDATRDQLGEVIRQLAHVEAEKRELQQALVATTQRLHATEVELSAQTARTDAAVRDATDQKWWRFLGDSQLEICEKGSRKKLGACREAVQAYLGTRAVRDRFLHCVRSEQATPAVRLLGREQAMPRHGQYIAQDDKIVRDWYVQMCDPTLPEAPGATRPAAPSSLGAGFAFDDLDL